MPLRLLFVALFLLTASLAIGQPRPVSATLPTYNQLKPANREIYDYVSPRGTGYQLVDRTFQLFDYPDGTVTYQVNGKIVRKASDVRKRLTAPGVQIDSLSIGQPNADGKRLIRIRLLNNQP
jgi:hypothetical protein